MKTTERKTGTINFEGNDVVWKKDQDGLTVYYEEGDTYLQFGIVESEDGDGSYEYETLDISYGESADDNNDLYDLLYDIGDKVVNELEKTGELVARTK
jgi:hypothetical protein